MSNEELTDAIVEATKVAWSTLQSQFGDETFYGFALSTNHEMSYIGCTAWTEEDLQEAAEHYGYNSLDEINDLRFSPTDSPLDEVGVEAEAVKVAICGASLGNTKARIIR